MNVKVKRIGIMLICFTVIIALFSGLDVTASASASQQEIKNVILLIPDGMSLDAATLARLYNDGAPLAMDEIASGLVKTYWAGGPITDSAPAATAMATGHKANDGVLSILPNKVFMPNTEQVDPDDAKKPVATILEGAKLIGKATGLIATSPVMHATPAAFSSHELSRNNFESIAEQQVYQNIDVVLSTGSRYLMASNRADKEYLISAISSRGYKYVTNKEQMDSATGTKIWGMFGGAAYDGFKDTSMAYEMDRDTEKDPSLAEMTEKAIQTLSKGKNGFFLMIEGSKIDWAAHANDPIGVISDVLAFDSAVKTALDFAKADGHTVVIACSDHGNGGISIGNADSNSNYNKLPLSTFMDPLKKATLTGEGIEAKFDALKSNVKEVMSTYYGITDLSPAEEKAIKGAAAGNVNSVVGPMISKRAKIGWTTTGHTGEDVVLYCYSPNSDKLSGVVDNTDIAKYMARVLGVNLEEASERLFVNAADAFAAKDADMAIDKTDPNNPVIVITKDSTVMKLPVNKNIADIDGKRYNLEGLTLLIDDVAYVCQNAVDLIK